MGYPPFKRRRLAGDKLDGEPSNETAQPIIDPNRTHKRMVAKAAKIPDWSTIYKRRTAVERRDGRLKAHRRLNSLRVRGRMKVESTRDASRRRIAGAGVGYSVTGVGAEGGA